VAFNDTLAEEYAGGFVIKGAFGLFVLTHAMELYDMFFRAKNIVMKNFFFFILTITVITVLTYIFKSDLMYITDLLQVSALRIIVFIVIFTYVTYTKEFTKLLYMIWITMMVSSTIAFFSDPYEQYTFRRVGGTGNPNDFAAQILPIMFISIYLFKKNKSWIFLGTSLLFFLYTLIYAGSKSSFLILAMMLLFIFMVRFKQIIGFLGTTKGIVSLVLFVSLIVGGGVYLQQDEAVKGLQERSKKTGTMQQRFIIWNAGAEMIRDNFFLGVGFAQFPKVSGSYIKDYLPPEALPSHNNFIKVFAENGVFTFLAFMILIISLFTSKAREIFHSDYFWIYVGSLSAVLMGLTIPSLHHKDFWFSIALLSHVIYIFYQKEHQKVQEMPI
jgi:hypothetical protein